MITEPWPSNVKKNIVGDHSKSVYGNQMEIFIQNIVLIW